MVGSKKRNDSGDSMQDYSEWLAGRLLERFSGTTVNRISADKPSKEIFIGTIMSRSPSQVRWPKRAQPTEVGIEVMVPKKAADAAIRVVASCAFYYRVFPTLNEQLQNEIPPQEDEDEIVDESVPPPDEDMRGTQPLKRIWKKCGPFQIEVTVRTSDLPKHGTVVLNHGEGLARAAIEVWEKDPDRYRSRKYTSRDTMGRQSELRVPNEAMVDNANFDSYLRDWYKGTPPRPKWSTKLTLRVSEMASGNKRVAAILENGADDSHHSSDDIDNAIFESKVSMAAVGFDFLPIVLDRLRDDYRHTGRVAGIGINCVAEAQSMNPLNEVHVVHAPVYRQMRLHPKSFEVSLVDLGHDPLTHLSSLREEMLDYSKSLKGQLLERRETLSEEGRFFFEHDIELFESEIKRFSEGIKVIAEVEQAREAFALTNETFAMASELSGGRFYSWYRFQIVFLVSQIPDLVAPRFPQYQNKREQVDVIYFPTGGGKTEAYLSAVVFQIFFDRLMGKKAGVSAITRFPLRLLSLQQIQRISDVFGAAEQLRRRHKVIGGKGYDWFSTGYFVGEGNTPNRLYDPGYQGEGGCDEISPIIENPERGNKYRIIEHCPFCRSNSIKVVPDMKLVRIQFRCEGCGEILPLYISDDEIYRYLPTFVIGTLDKMASAGWRYHFRHIFGQVTHICPDHGYLSGGKCLYRGPGNLCQRSEDDYVPVELDDPTPSLIIQDELHLVRESLGCYDSHYETFLDELELSITNGAKRPKIIAATATISNPDVQADHLYKRRGAEFPSRGPNLRESFYYREDEEEVSRLIVGILPHNRTMLHAVLDLIGEHAAIVRAKEAEYQGAEKGSSDRMRLEAILRNYSMVISYNLMKWQGDRIGLSVKTMVNPGLRARGLREIRSQSMTGDVTFDQVRRVLEMMQRPSEESGIDLITATNMISHGVDVDSLNVMIFQGMPNSTAEYIQAYSRVGRQHTGLVLVVFNHARERDGSHYKYFHNYHELSDLLVEPVPINRWAKFSIDRTLPGIFCASIMNFFEPRVQAAGYRRLYMTDDFTKAVNTGALTENEVLEFILRSYRVSEDDRGRHFADVITASVRDLFGRLTAPLENKFLASAMPVEPLRSLRDTDVQVEISRTPASYKAMDCVSAPPLKEED